MFTKMKLGLLTTFRIAVVLAIFGGVAAFPQIASAGKIDWLTYTDSRYGFSIDYPATWVVIPRDDQEGTSGGVLTLAPQSTIDTGTGVRVVIGLYTVERDPTQSLAKWTDLYERSSSIFDSSEVKINRAEAVRSPAGDNRKGFIVQGVSPESEFRFTNIPHGRTVWFIWMNSQDAFFLTYKEMADSFRFSGNTPTTLAEAYNLGPSPLVRDTPISSIAMGNTRRSPGLADYRSIFVGSPDYRLPFSGTYVITNGPGCSSTHIGTSSEAIDYGLPTNTGVLATKTGNVAFAGWNTQGFGNLVTIDHGGGYYSYYAHLNSFVNLYSGKYVYQGLLIAYSDNTGNSTGAHLHFEVRLNGQSNWIRTLTTTTWYSGDPNNPCQPGQNDGTATGP
jgi:murein DD-endopeptidase MepM/ murein hydrolase activator NlpD